MSCVERLGTVFFPKHARPDKAHEFLARLHAAYPCSPADHQATDDEKKAKNAKSGDPHPLELVKSQAALLRKHQRLHGFSFMLQPRSRAALAIRQAALAPKSARAPAPAGGEWRQSPALSRQEARSRPRDCCEGQETSR